MNASEARAITDKAYTSPRMELLTDLIEQIKDRAGKGYSDMQVHLLNPAVDHWLKKRGYKVEYLQKSNDDLYGLISW